MTHLWIRNRKRTYSRKEETELVTKYFAMRSWSVKKVKTGTQNVSYNLFARSRVPAELIYVASVYAHLHELREIYLEVSRIKLNS
jgi:hypothetical protein